MAKTTPVIVEQYDVVAQCVVRLQHHNAIQPPSHQVRMRFLRDRPHRRVSHAKSCNPGAVVPTNMILSRNSLADKRPFNRSTAEMY